MDYFLILWNRTFGALGRSYYLWQILRCLPVALFFSWTHHKGIDSIISNGSGSILFKTLLFPYSWYAMQVITHLTVEVDEVSYSFRLVVALIGIWLGWVWSLILGPIGLFFLYKSSGITIDTDNSVSFADEEAEEEKTDEELVSKVSLNKDVDK